MQDDDDLPNLRRGPGWFAVIATSLFVSVLASAGTVVWLHRERPRFLGLTVREEAVVTVPALRHLPVEAAREILSARGLKLARRGVQADPEVPADRVAAQSPEAGERVARGRVVQVDLSRGPVPVVPPVLGRSLADARAALAATGIPVGSTEETGVVPPGTVTATRPAVGEPVVPGTGVALVLTPAGPPTGTATPAGPPTGTATPAEGAAAELVEVPAVRLMSLRRAKESLEAAGLAVGQVRVVYDSNARPRVVLRQSIEPASRATRGTAVDLVINQGE
jgi:beta-lactam-binding protein with PASTA domain